MKAKSENKHYEKKLTQIEEEYEIFAYIVSHDLNAPLRHIREFTRLLIGSRGNNLNDEEKDYVEFLSKSLDKVEKMQNALLSFSRLNTRVEPFVKTDCNMVLEGVLKELEQKIREHSTDVSLSSLPSIECDPKQLHLLFVCLIDNAIKFHNEEAIRRKVSVSAKKNKKNWMFEVKDTGIGIQKEYQKEIFRMFRRLEPAKFDGIGAGLSVARKIVQKHGGEIYIESEQGKGTSVFFTLPSNS